MKIKNSTALFAAAKQYVAGFDHLDKLRQEKPKEFDAVQAARILKLDRDYLRSVLATIETDEGL